MAGGWLLGRGGAVPKSYGFSGTDSGLTTLTCGSSNAKGVYAELISATTADTSNVRVFVSGSASTGAALSVDIAVGALGSEVIVLPDLALQLHSITEFDFPIQILAGSRITARAQSSTGADTAKVAVTTMDDTWPNTIAGSAVDCLGFTSGTSKGAIVDAGTSANTKGLYTQIIASTAYDYSGFVLCCANPSGSSIATAAHILLDLAVGAAASEKIIFPNHYVRNVTTGSTQLSTTPYLGIPISSGVRVAAKCQCSLTTSPQRTVLVTVYGVRA